MNRIIYIIATVLQIMTIASIFILEFLSRRKAGVNHHLIARKYQLKEGLFNDFNLIFLLVIMILVLLSLILISKKIKKINLDKLEILKLLFITIFFIFSNYSQTIKAMNSYVYILTGNILIYIIQLSLVFKNMRLN